MVPKECERHGCQKEEELQKCPYCYEHFCEQHIKPIKTGNNNPGRNQSLWQKNDDQRETNCHPCSPYVLYLDTQEKIEKDRYRESLERLTKKDQNLEMIKSS